MSTVLGLADLAGSIGKHLGYSNWHLVDQEQMNRLADATGDHQWIHVERAGRAGWHHNRPRLPHALPRRRRGSCPGPG
jgi:acyl dehydratase